MAAWQFWLIAAALVLACAGLMLRVRPLHADSAPKAIALYRAQLAEIERDLLRGTLQKPEADRLRLEVSRRLLEADKMQTAQPTRSEDRRLLGGVVIAILAASFAGYIWLGAPLYADLPLQARISAAEDLRAARPDQATAEAAVTLPEPSAPDAAFAALMDRLRTTVAARPDDLTGLALLARNEAAIGNLVAARAAQTALIAAKGNDVTAQDHADLAEMMIAQAGGYVSPQAEAILTQALQIDPANATARYYAGLMMGQVGRFDLGFRMWRPLADGPEDAPWMPAFRVQMPDMAALAGVEFELPALRGPSAADIAAAEGMTDADRTAMITGMVAQLSDRLATDGGPPEDWARLITALLVLGDTAQAATIRTEAEQVFAGNTAALATISAAAVP